jgi:hypothetical protein
MAALVGRRGRVPKRWRATALRRRWRVIRKHCWSRSVVECAGPPALWPNVPFANQRINGVSPDVVIWSPSRLPPEEPLGFDGQI